MSDVVPTFNGYDNIFSDKGTAWGVGPSSFLQKFIDLGVPKVSSAAIEIGCAEGRNAAALARSGYNVVAVDISAVAIAKCRELWPDSGIEWRCADAAKLDYAAGEFDVVCSYGFVHCLPDESAVVGVLERSKRWTIEGGHHVFCAFNSRDQDLSGHPEFSPTLLSHDRYRELYGDWEILSISDETLYETHASNGIPHHHSLTRILARKRQ